MSYASEATNAIAEGIAAKTSVSRESAGYKAPGQTAFTYSALVSLTGAVTTIFLGTIATTNPTTGLPQNVYISDFQASSDFANANGNLDVQLQVAGVTQIRASLHNLAPVEMMAIETQPQGTAGGANQLVIAAASVNTHLWYYVSGWAE